MSTTLAPTLLLAPMEGLMDHHLRAVLTQMGGVRRCVSEFIRITDQRLPERVFTRVMPELLNGSRTSAGTPVRAQLLGSDPACLADNAATLASLGAEGIDLNFGCPAPTVNRHRGGAVLLDDPELVHAIVAAVRRAVPAALPVSAKMRLGHRDRSRMLDNAHAIAAGGAAELVVHARTKVDGYRPPAYWELIAPIREALPIPVVANGEIWTVRDALRCARITGCETLMIGRGAVADPRLAADILEVASAGGRERDDEAGTERDARGWAQVQPLLSMYWQRVAAQVAPRHSAGRLKQWLNLLRRRYPQAQRAFDELRTVTDPRAVTAWLQRPPAAEPT